MTQYNLLLNTHFRGRPLLGQMPDVNRGRILKAYYIGEDDVVGVSDGVESWISPLTACHDLNLPRLLEDYKAGKIQQPITRRSIVADEVHQPLKRREVRDNVPRRRRIHVD